MSEPATDNLQYASLLSKTTPQQAPSQNEARPTIFDILAQENMHQLFRQAFNHVFKWLDTTFIGFRRVNKYRDEIYLTLHSFIEFLYLKAYNGLFSETFYGLRRVNLNSNLKRVMSIAFSVIIPYLKAKLDELYEEVERLVDEPELVAPTGLKRVLNKIMLVVYPYFNLIWHCVFWMFRFRFIINASPYNSPLLKILGVKLVYNLDQALDTQKPSLFRKILTGSNYAFTSLIYLVQFYQWYEQYNTSQSFNRDNQVSLAKALFGHATNVRATIPPPSLPDKLAKSIAYKSISQGNLCPICSQPRTNECALSVSGFVFCYPCIFKFVREHKRCPLSHYPANTGNIVRIYDST